MDPTAGLHVLAKIPTLDRPSYSLVAIQTATEDKNIVG